MGANGDILNNEILSFLGLSFQSPVAAAFSLCVRSLPAAAGGLIPSRSLDPFQRLRNSAQRRPSPRDVGISLCPSALCPCLLNLLACLPLRSIIDRIWRRAHEAKGQMHEHSALRSPHSAFEPPAGTNSKVFAKRGVSLGKDLARLRSFAATPTLISRHHPILAKTANFQRSCNPCSNP